MWGSICWLLRVPSICELTDILVYQTPLASYANMSTCHTYVSCDKCTSEHYYDDTSAVYIETVPAIVTGTDYLTSSCPSSPPPQVAMVCLCFHACTECMLKNI